MARHEFELSSAQIAALGAYLPSDLTEKQTAKVIEAATVMAGQVWQEAQAVAIQKDRLLREAREADASRSRED